MGKATPIFCPSGLMLRASRRLTGPCSFKNRLNPAGRVAGYQTKAMDISLRKAPTRDPASGTGSARTRPRLAPNRITLTSASTIREPSQHRPVKAGNNNLDYNPWR